MDDSMDGGGRTVPGATVEEVACVRNKQSRDVGRYDCTDAGGRTVPGATVEGNARSSCRDARFRGHDGIGITT
jgi:hypothetical protein